VEGCTKEQPNKRSKTVVPPSTVSTRSRPNPDTEIVDREILTHTAWEGGNNET
jgi:hypothetical protein